MTVKIELATGGLDRIVLMMYGGEPCCVIHQTGPMSLEEIEEEYAEYVGFERSEVTSKVLGYKMLRMEML